MEEPTALLTDTIEKNVSGLPEYSLNENPENAESELEAAATQVKVACVCVFTRSRV